MIDRIVALLGRGHTLRAALARVGWLPEDWRAALAADPGALRLALLARGVADFRQEEALLALVESGGAQGAKALEEISARRRLDLPLGSSDERTSLERLLGDPARVDALSEEDRAALDTALEALEAASALADRVLGG